MCKRVLLVFLIIFVFLPNTFSTNVNIKYDNYYNIIDFSIYDDINKFGVKFMENKIESINLLKFSQNKLKIEKENKFKNKEIYISKASNFYLNIIFEKFSFYTRFLPLNCEKNTINSLSFLNEKLKYEFIFYNINEEKDASFYYDFTNLKYTKKGIINYLNCEYKIIDIYQEFAISKYGFFYSTKLCLNFKKIQIYFLNKNINEKYRYGFIFKKDPINVEMYEKIYPISLYSGQGKKREYDIKSEFNYDFVLIKTKININMKIQHQILYDKYLNKKINNSYNFKSNFTYNKKKIEFALNFENEISYYLKINNVKIIYNNNKIFIQIDYLNQKENKKYYINLSSDGVIKLTYNIYL